MNIALSRLKIVSIIFLLGLLVFSSFLLMSRYNASGAIQYGDAWQGSVTISRAAKLAQDYLTSLGDRDLAIDEITEFELNFYIIYYEKNTGMGAFEAIIDKASSTGMMWMMHYGTVRPEQGPSMMWNTKYGMHNVMGRSNILVNASVTEIQAREYAQRYLDTNFPNATAADVHNFYGYYTIHASVGGRIFGMVSVNAYSGQVWYHNWHGGYIQTLEIRKE